MRIAFVPGACIPFHGRTLETRPLGGIETAVIRLAEALDRLGHTVFVFSPCSSIPVTKPLYLPLSAIPDVGALDVLVSVRDLRPLFLGIRARETFFWTGDSYDQLQHLGLGDKRVAERLSALWAVSHWHADTLCATSGFPRQRTWIVRNGHAPELFTGTELRAPKRLIYTSTPYRGLQTLASVFPLIHQAHPDCELHVFSGFKVYDGVGRANDEMENQYRPLFDLLSRTDGVIVHGNVKQDQLARELMRSAVMPYPNTFEETSCISAIEALAAGCPVVTSRRAALPETVADAGVLIDGDPRTKAYRDSFTASVINLLNDPQAWGELSNRCRERSKSTSWNAIAANLSERLRSLLTTSSQPKVHL